MKTSGGPWWKSSGVLYKVVIPMFTSPIIGFFAGLVLMTVLYVLLRHWRPATVSGVFGRLQLGSAGYMGWSHGFNDAQKTMGIITLALVAGTKAGALDNVPDVFAFLRMADMGDQQAIPAWIKIVCAIVMAAGTAAGGWRIIHTLGHKMVKLQPVHGFAAETTAASVLFFAGNFGMPVSTTHAITASILGVGSSKRWSALNFPVVKRILSAWFLTIPATAIMSYGAMRFCQVVGWSPPSP